MLTSRNQLKFQSKTIKVYQGSAPRRNTQANHNPMPNMTKLPSTMVFQALKQHSASGPARYNKNLMLGYGNFLKLKNKTCHFCKNATNKRKLSCESEFCSRVYCSRNNCLKKLKATYGEDFPFDDLYLENNMYDEKRFICPHCKDNTRCLSNYCKKKNRLMFSSELTSTQLERIRPPSEKWAGLLKAEERPALGSDGADRMAGCRRGGERKSFSPPNLARVGPPGGRQVRFEAPDLENISPPMSKFNLSLLGNL